MGKKVGWGVLCVLLLTGTCLWQWATFVTMNEKSMLAAGGVDPAWLKGNVSFRELDRRLTGQEAWRKIRHKIKPTDDIWRFAMPNRGWPGLQAKTGYIIRRKGRSVGWVGTQSDQRTIEYTTFHEN